jgi:hypothetical protein
VIAAGSISSEAVVTTTANAMGKCAARKRRPKENSGECKYSHGLWQHDDLLREEPCIRDRNDRCLVGCSSDGSESQHEIFRNVGGACPILPTLAHSCCISAEYMFP